MRKKSVPSEFEKNQHPIQMGHGSLLPSALIKRLWYVTMRKIQSEEKPISQPIRIHRGCLGDTEYNYSEAYPDRLFSRWLWDSDENKIVFDVTADGSPTAYFTCLSGENLHGEKVLMTFTLDDIAAVKRCDKAVAVSSNGAMSTLAFGVFSAFSEILPVWAELTTLVGLASTAFQARVRCLIEFNSDDVADDVAEEKQPFIIADLPEVAFLLLDALTHEPRWHPQQQEEQEEVVSEDPITAEA
jgi:hypothetical protein